MCVGFYLGGGCETQQKKRLGELSALDQMEQLGCSVQVMFKLGTVCSRLNLATPSCVIAGKSLHLSEHPLEKGNVIVFIPWS